MPLSVRGTLPSLVSFSLCEFLKIRSDLDFSLFFSPCMFLSYFVLLLSFPFLLSPDNLGRSVLNNLEKLSYFIQARLIEIVWPPSRSEAGT